jgi:FkbM family methyltransferase
VVLRGSIAKAIEAAGFTASRVKPAATPLRPVGNLRSFLEDIRARGFTPNHIVDVGANKGEWSWVAHEVWPHAKFTLIEPQVEMKPYLDVFTKHVDSQWIQAGAAESIGNLTLTINPNSVSSTFVLSEREGREAGLLTRRVVPVVTLDSILVEGANTPELVKIDAEELELSVLRGAKQYFGSTELFIVEVSHFEWHQSTSTFVDIVAFMRERGYLPYDFCGFMRRPLDGALALTDVVFARERGLLRSQTRWA